jgi:hypothetical protein
VLLFAAAAATAIGCAFLLFWIPTTQAPAGIPRQEMITQTTVTPIIPVPQPVASTSRPTHLAVVPLPHLRPRSKIDFSSQSTPFPLQH